MSLAAECSSHRPQARLVHRLAGLNGPFKEALEALDQRRQRSRLRHVQKHAPLRRLEDAAEVSAEDCLVGGGPPSAGSVNGRRIPTPLDPQASDRVSFPWDYCDSGHGSVLATFDKGARSNRGDHDTSGDKRVRKVGLEKQHRPPQHWQD